ncbi:HD/deoxyguanosinetriphosphate triphosphohydrolase domains protein [Mycoplasma haemocanis str. Illinois]|uniref:HD/deoxyguanosinetriphosphate triphosphohydrolase domains protein n=1 Tax=Mycoplasma haemocanis (strain Illinois) TaxID=1111676 RepID=H6N5J8_MYCHN|nr:HD domain-containing protein [Mycoplasma haemocanis]AEW44958.1 HD/deoxyguanosinetriphosphate triphosphohydrolase domains protein [Mycoplasma haemocanis str. Illinois]
MSSLLDFSRLHLRENKVGSFFIKDPILKGINFSINQFWLYEIVNTFEFQRLSQIKQLSLTVNNFPSSTHTRLTHSLGVYELCNRFTKHFINAGDLDPVKDKVAINIALASALLHDIGHGPLSHTLEKAFPHFHHEQMSVKILNSADTKINSLLRKKALSDGLHEWFYIREIEKVLNKTSEYKWIVDLISSSIDIDRLDFLVRDSYYSGVRYGNTIDVNLFIKWSLLRNDKEGKLRFLFLKKAKNMIGSFLLTRYHMYEELYKNKVSLIYEEILKRIFQAFKKHSKELRDNFYFRKIKFFFNSESEWNVLEFLELSDEILLFMIDNILKEGIPEFKELRALFSGFLNAKNVDEYLEIWPLDSNENVAGDLIKVNLWDSKKEEIFNMTVNISDFYN